MANEGDMVNVMHPGGDIVTDAVGMNPETMEVGDLGEEEGLKVAFRHSRSFYTRFSCSNALCGRNFLFLLSIGSMTIINFLTI